MPSYLPYGFGGGGATGGGGGTQVDPMSGQLDIATNKAASDLGMASLQGQQQLQLQQAQAALQKALQGQSLGAQEAMQVQGINSQQYMQGRSLAESLKEALIQQQTSEYPATLKQQRFNQLFPLISGGFNDISGLLRGGASAAFGGGGTVGADYPTQQSINAGWANAQQGTETNIRNMNQDIGARGFGANSPLSQALAAQFRGQGLQTGAQSELGARQAGAQNAIGMAQANAPVAAAGINAAASQYAARLGSMNALVAALAGLAG